MKRGVDIPGLISYYDPDNDYNRVIYSSIKDLELQSLNLGISIKYVCSGEENYWIDDKEYKVGPQQFLVVNHQRDIGVNIRSNEKVDGICLYIDPSWLEAYQTLQKKTSEQLLDAPYFNNSASLPCRELVFQSFQTPLHQIIQKITRPDQFYLESQEDFYYELTASIAFHENEVQNQIKKIGADKKSTREELYRRLLISVQFIHDHLDKKILIKDVARAACLSEFHFMRSFKQAFGYSPNQYIRHQRISKANNLLKTGKYSVSEVSSLCGFSDHHYFSRCFKKIKGVPPSKVY